jgi:hypothetical protein
MVIPQIIDGFMDFTGKTLDKKAAWDDIEKNL